MQITGEALDEFMELVGKPHNLENTRLLLHCAVVLANEVGQPKGQDLADKFGKRRSIRYWLYLRYFCRSKL